MANSLETRAPYLDRDVVEFLLGLPSQLKINATESKIIMRRAFENLWPAEINKRPKLGFGAPFKVWLRQPDVKTMAGNIFSRGSPLHALFPGFSPDCFNPDNYQSWLLLILGVWLQKQGEVL